MPIARQLPADCEGLARPIALPPITAGKDARVALAEHRAALVQDNGRLAAVRACEARQRAEYADPGK